MPVFVRRAQTALLYAGTALISLLLVLRSETLAADDGSWDDSVFNNSVVAESKESSAPPQREASVDPRAKRMTEALATIDRAEKALATISDYTCHMTMKERLNGKLGVDNKVELSVRHGQFAVHMKWHEPRSMAGQEVVYNRTVAPSRMRVKGAGFLGSVGFISLGLDDPRAKSTSRHTVAEAGLANTVARVKASWSRLPVEHIADIQIEDGSLGGRPCRHIVLTNSESARGTLEFQRTTLWFDAATGLLAGLDGHGWPAAGQKEGELLESYHYHNMRLNPALPNQHFTR